MKKILIFGIIMALTLLILGCNDRHDRYGPLTPEEELKVKLGGVNINIPDEYSVNFDFSYGSPGGDRSWEVSYGVASGEFTACPGEYHFSGQGDEKTEPCTLEMLQTSEIALFPKMNDIVLVDLPGIIANGPGKVEVTNMINKYIGQEETLILENFKEYKKYQSDVGMFFPKLRFFMRR